MLKSVIISFLLSLTFIKASAADSLVANGNKFRFIPNISDTVRDKTATYVVKYVYQPEEAYIMRSNGKIYVVVVVLATIFAGIFAYLVMLDRKIARIEKEKK
jgi:CcmD family protein